MSTKILVVIYNSNDWESIEPLEKSPETRKSFEEFYEFSRSLNIEVYRSSIQWFEKNTFCFTKGWKFLEKQWIRVDSPIYPDAVFDKVSGKYDYSLFELKQEINQKIPLKNPPLFRTLFDNKLAQYLAFSEFMPKSYVAENRSQLENALQKIRTEKFVVKEIYGSGGKQVSIETRVNKNGYNYAFPVLIQEFIETVGIPGFSAKESVADLRLVYINNELIYALSRIAKEGSLFTNFHQGARAVLVPQESIPKDCLTLSEKIRKKLEIFPQTNYSLDFMFDKNGIPFFIEMNTTPGFDLLRLVAPLEIRQNYYKKLLHTLLQNNI